jgi:hypothetical protein
MRNIDFFGLKQKHEKVLFNYFDDGWLSANWNDSKKGFF